MSASMVRIYESELSCIVHETVIHPKIETGGSLFGLWTDAGNPTILLASRPGPQAVRQVTQFEQDAGTHRLIERLLLERFGAQGIGLWHSHHHLGLHELSGGDIRRTMRFAARAERKRFCDLLSYFTERLLQSKRSADVTVKPYVYVDASSGQRAPTSLVVLPGTSPVRAALSARDLPRHVLAELGEALLPAPDRSAARCRLGNSVELAGREDEDRPAQSGRTVWPKRKGRPDAIEGPDVAERKSGGANPARPAGPESAPRDVPEPTPFTGPEGQAGPAAIEAPTDVLPYAIPDLEQYIHEQLEPTLRGVPHGIGCELEPIAEGQWLRLTLVSASRHEQHVLDLGWDGSRSVITRYIVRLAQRPGPEEMLPHGKTLVGQDQIRNVLNILAHTPHGR